MGIKDDIMWELYKIPGVMGLETDIRCAKIDYTEKKKEKKLNKQELLAAEKNIKYCRDSMNKKLEAIDSGAVKTVLMLENIATSKLVQYALYFLIDPKANILQGISAEEKALLNGVASMFGFNKIYESANIADLEKYDMEYKEKYDGTSKFFLSLKDIKATAGPFREKMFRRKMELGIVDNIVDDREKCITNLEKIVMLDPVSHADSIGFRVVDVCGSSECMAVIQMITEARNQIFLYHDIDMCNILFRNRDKMSNEILQNFYYIPDDIEYTAILLETIIPRFKNIDCKAQNIEGIRRGELHKPFALKTNVNFVKEEEISKLDHKSFEILCACHNNWIENDYSQIFERAPSDFWIKKMRGIDSSLNEVKKKIQRKKNLSYGIQGEKNVEYALKWLCHESADYILIEQGDDGICLKCSAISDEIQQIDHIIIGPQGIFAIETKYYSGKITIDECGNWIQEKSNGIIEGKRNPVQQIDRHHTLLKRILNMDDYIIDIICIAHEKAVIIGEENSPVPIVKVDQLARYIKGYKGIGRQYISLEERLAIKNKIEKARI